MASTLGLAGPAEVMIEYVLGLAFGWMIFQALFTREMAGATYSRSLINTFIPELLSMNLLVGGMLLRRHIVSGADAATPAFWFVLSIGLLVGFVIAYPMNWWLVANHLKHGMMTERSTRMPSTIQDQDADTGARRALHGTHQAAVEVKSVPRPPVRAMALLSFAALAAGLAIAYSLGTD